jgi:hypothetical protein
VAAAEVDLVQQILQEAQQGSLVAEHQLRAKREAQEHSLPQGLEGLRPLEQRRPEQHSAVSEALVEVGGRMAVVALMVLYPVLEVDFYGLVLVVGVAAQDLRHLETLTSLG